MRHEQPSLLISATARVHLAQYLNQNRVDLGDRIAERTPDAKLGSARLMLRTLVAALARSVEESDPSILVHWARIARGAHSRATVTGAIASACAEISALAEHHDFDPSAMLTFLEFAQVQVELQLADESGHPHEDVAIASALAMLRARDEATCEHSQQTGTWARRLAEAMRLATATTDRIVKAAILHDIGKISIPDAILMHEGPLDPVAWSTMQRHASFGADILAEIPSLAPYAPVVRAHHERIDGTGYPYGLRGDEISLEARVVAVADGFHAMITDRPYRRAMTFGTAMSTLREGSGTQWDAAVVDIMVGVAAAHRSRAVDSDLALGVPPGGEVAVGGPSHSLAG
jgi:HD-GYP domain-containing protein (c-di-GMP phosphodiesterase class II)